MKDILWMLLVIIQHFRATLLLLTVITGKKQAFWNSNEMQGASFTGLTPLLLAICQICCQWESDSARWRTVKSAGPAAAHAGFQPDLKWVTKHPFSAMAGGGVDHGCLKFSRRWECFTGNGEMLKAPGPGTCCNSISIFIKKTVRKALPLPVIFFLLGFFHSSGLLAVFNNDVNGICFH